MFLSRPTGTFITEWKEGERLCEAFLAGDERSYQAVARQLVLIAQFFRFDGWLINIENSLSVSTPAPGAWPTGPCAPRGPSIALLGLIRPVPATAALPPSQLEPAPTPLPLHREMDVLQRGVQKPCVLSFASLAPSRRPLLCSRRMCGFLFTLPSPFIAFYRFLIAVSMSFLLQKEQKVGPLAGPSA